MSRQFLLIIFVFCLLNLNFAAYLNWRYTHPILGDIVVSPTPVTVSADIDYNPTIIIKPEKRIPPLHNDSLYLDVSLRPHGVGATIFSTTATSDNDGTFRITVPSSLITGRYYDVLIKGLSHLRRSFDSQDFNQGVGFVLDLRDPVLFAGDSHPTADNYINSLDISYEIQNLYTGNTRADLNRDTVVNSLEFPTLISHLYDNGD